MTRCGAQKKLNLNASDFFFGGEYELLPAKPELANRPVPAPKTKCLRKARHDGKARTPALGSPGDARVAF